MQYPRVTIIIVNWNNPEDTFECIESVIQMDYNPLDVLIVDNGSNDGSAKKILDHLMKKNVNSNFKEEIIKDEKMDFKVKKISNGMVHQIYLIENERNEGPTGGK
jgi:GT2 family glycosyltransferase